MAKTVKATDSQTSKVPPPIPRQVGSTVVRMIEAFLLLPFHAYAEGRKQSIRSLLHEATGLSKARIAQGNLEKIRPSTLRAIEIHQNQLLEKSFSDNQAALENFRERIAKLPKISSGSYAMWAGWVHMFENLPNCSLPISKAVALVADELLVALHDACLVDDLATFKRILQDHLMHHGLTIQWTTESVVLSVPEEELAILQAVTNWEQAEELIKKTLDYLYWDIISTLDAEWSGEYFGGRASSPLFSLVMVRPQDGLLETMRITSRKNILHRPSRRLLEFLYALIYFCRYKNWPKIRPTPKEIAEAIDDENLIERKIYAATVSNHFDGSLKLTLDLVSTYWNLLCKKFLQDRKEGNFPAPPDPLIMLALQWQKLLVWDNGRSFVVLNEQQYSVLWENRRNQWNVQQVEQMKNRPLIGQHKTEPIEWPKWMIINQFSSSLV